jgi:hypothetical protein
MRDNNETAPAAFRGLREKSGADYRDPKIGMALALSRVKHESQVYAGTVPQHVKADRRRRNRVARASRKINRRSR